MIEPIVIKVVDKVPIVVSGPQYVVCDNSDYTVVWQLDEEWAQFESRTMQVNYKDGTYERVLFTGDTCALPAIPVPGPVHVGLFAGDIHTTRPARLLAVRSATTDSGEERDSMPNGYAQAIKALDGKLDKNQGAENAGKALVVGDDGTVVPGEAQGGSLPAMSSDTKGKMLTNDGEKAEWGEVPKEVMVVNFAQDNGGKWSADKSWDDAAALIEAGGYVYAMIAGISFPFSTYLDNNFISFMVLMTSPSYIKYNAFRWHQDGTIEAVLDALLPVVMYGEQELTADQQAQARANIGLTPVAKTDAMTQNVGLDAETGELWTAPAAGGDESLGITSASVGQLIKVQEVDADGKPTKWKAVDDRLPAVGVTEGLVLMTRRIGEFDYAYVLGEIDNSSLGIYTAKPGQFIKVQSLQDGEEEIGAPLEWTPVDDNFTPMVVNITPDDSGTLSADKTFAEILAACQIGRPVKAKFDTVALEMPLAEYTTTQIIFRAPQFSNNQLAQYAQIVITETEVTTSALSVPSSDNTLGITSATVGQIAKITAVDTEGKPTEWEAVDMPSGGSDEWELIQKVTIADSAEESNRLTINADKSGNPFSLKRAKIYGYFPAYTGESTIPTYSFFMLNGITTVSDGPYCYTSGWVVPQNTTITFCSVDIDLTKSGLQSESVSRSRGATGIEYFGPSHINTITSIGGTNMLIYPGCRFELYGVRA